MLYRDFGNTGEKVSILGFGCMRFPIKNGNMNEIDEEKASEMLRYAIDNGVNYIDTAYPYHGTGMGDGGMSEPFVGKVLKDGYREKVKLATKLPTWLIEKREDMDRYLNEQLKRLQTEYIDYYLIHTLNKERWKNVKDLGVTEFLDKSKEKGKIKYTGFSFHDDDVELFKKIVDSYDWDFCQIQYNYVDTEYQAGLEGLKYAADKGLGIVIMEPLRGGSLANNLPGSAQDVMKENNKNRTPVEWALRWLWNHPTISVVLSGMSEMSQVVENIKIAQSSYSDSMTKDELEVIKKVKKILKERVKVSCTACSYCMPCPHGVNIPSCFSYYNDFFRFDDNQTRAHSKMMYNTGLDNKEKASNCVNCGVCESHCPQEIKIREKLKEVKELFETNE